LAPRNEGTLKRTMSANHIPDAEPANRKDPFLTSQHAPVYGMTDLPVPLGIDHALKVDQRPTQKS